MAIGIREVRAEDVAAIRDVNKRAFDQDHEGKIVDALRSNRSCFAFARGNR